MIDFSTSAWREVAAWADDELAKARIKNDNRLSDVDTAALRGEIQFIKRLLALPRMTATLAEMAAPQDLGY